MAEKKTVLAKRIYFTTYGEHDTIATNKQRLWRSRKSVCLLFAQQIV